MLCLLAAALVGGWYYASPWWAMKSLAGAAQSGDIAALEQQVDFPSLRQSAGEQAQMLVQREEGRGTLVDLIGSAAAQQAGQLVIDRVVNADNVGTLIATGAMASRFLPERLRGQAIGWDVEREGFDDFRGVGTFEDGTPGPVLLFRRDGLDWKLAGLDLAEFTRR